MKSIRIGDTVTKAPSVIHQQIAEIRAIGNNEQSVASIIQDAVAMLYAQRVMGVLEKRAEFWEKEYHALYDKMTAQLNQ